MARLPSNVCIICSKPLDDTFYDKSQWRPICSKECYSKYFDKWKATDDGYYNNERRRLINKRAAKKYRENHTEELREYNRKYQREYGTRRRMQG